MALIHEATLTPSKLELLAAWLPGRPWAGDVTGLRRLGAYRFDDPDGEVGIETHILSTSGGHLLQVPLTYRGAALEGAEEFLVCTMEHSVLGRRWIYDATGDPVYAGVLASVLLAGAVQAEELVEGADAPREPSVRVTGSGPGSRGVPTISGVDASSDGSTTLMETSGDLRIVICRRLDPSAPSRDRESILTGIWPGREAPVLLAYVA